DDWSDRRTVDHLGTVILSASHLCDPTGVTVALEPGSSFAGYTVRSLLGAGGMGEVYLVEHGLLKRSEALKLISAAGAHNPDFTRRFTDEARTAATLNHPGIVTIHAYGIEDGTPWFTMAYLDGTDLDDEPLTLAELTQVITEVADALDHAHSRGVIHRDIKPANIMISRHDDGSLDRVIVLDFGIAKTVDAGHLTATNAVIGTFAYLAPELTHGHPASPASDQYSLAATAYRLLTGTTPFSVDGQATPAAIIAAHATGRPAAPLSAHRPDLAHLDPVFARALHPHPHARFATCRMFAAALSGTLRSPATGIQSRPDPAPFNPAQAAAYPPTQTPGWPGYPAGIPPTDTPRRRTSRPLLIVAAVFAVALIAVVTTLLVTRGSADSGGDGTAHGAATTASSQAVATSSMSSCAIRSGTLYCWGDNSFGQLGDGTTTNRTTPAAVPGLADVTAVSSVLLRAGDQTPIGAPVCAVAGGEVYCWGISGYNGNGAFVSSPTHIDGLSEVTALSVNYGPTIGGAVACGITHGTVSCWSLDNVNGRLATQPPTTLPGLTDVSDVSSQCAVAGGAAYCWQWATNDYADPADDTPSTPSRIAGINNVTAITDRCVIADGSVRCWNSSAGTVNRGVPTPVSGITDPTLLAVDRTACAVAAGDVYCWGQVVTGMDQYGSDDYTERATPAAVPGLTGVTSIATDSGTVIALAGGAVYRWGSNKSGPLDRTTPPDVTPVAVTLP
ncbi:MAG: protein kinase, partial [Gordonia sp. (in: high G+C Gram-positive bacteria)]